jgi:hypothetical protein
VTDVNGRATFADLAISGSAGSYTIRFTATGFTAVESAPITLSLNQSSTQIVADTPDPSVVGEAVMIQFAVEAADGATGSPTGSVTVNSDGGESCTASVSDAGCSITFGAAGSFNLTATYSGDASFDASASNPEPHGVVEAAPPPVGLRGVRSSQAVPSGA